jgi:hypothetical protein
MVEVVEAQSDLVPADWNYFDHDCGVSHVNVVDRHLLVENALVSPESLVADREPVWAPEAVYPYSEPAVYELSRGRQVGEVAIQAGLADHIEPVLEEADQPDLEKVD